MQRNVAGEHTGQTQIPSAQTMPAGHLGNVGPHCCGSSAEADCGETLSSESKNKSADVEPNTYDKKENERVIERLQDMKFVNARTKRWSSNYSSTR